MVQIIYKNLNNNSNINSSNTESWSVQITWSSTSVPGSRCGRWWKIMILYCFYNWGDLVKNDYGSQLLHTEDMSCFKGCSSYLTKRLMLITCGRLLFHQERTKYNNLNLTDFFQETKNIQRKRKHQHQHCRKNHVSISDLLLSVLWPNFIPRQSFSKRILTYC